MGFTSDKVTDYLSSYYKPLDEDLGELRAFNEERNVPLILRETETFLSLILEMTQPRRILEIGTAYGYSAVFFARVSVNPMGICRVQRLPLQWGRYHFYDYSPAF